MSIHTTACEAVQLFAKLRDSDENGYIKCCTCGKIVPWEEADGGHCIPKGNTCNQASIDPRNVNGQCRVCNSTPNPAPMAEIKKLLGIPAAAEVVWGNQSTGNVEPSTTAERYERFIGQRYGDLAYTELQALGKKLLSREDAHLAVDLYRRLCRRMAKKKSFKVNIP